MAQPKTQNNFVAIIVMIFLFGMIAFVTNLASPMGVVLRSQFTVSNFLGTLGVFATFIAYAVMGIPGGLLLQRKGYKKTALIAIAVGFLGVGIQTFSGTIGTNFAMVVYLAGAFVAGFSMCLLNTVVNPMLNTLGGGGNRGNRLIQIGGSFSSLCGTAVIIVVGILIGDITKARISDVYPVMFIALAIFALAFVILLLSKIPEMHSAGHRQKLPHSPLVFRHFMLGAIGVFIYVGIEVGVQKALFSFLADWDLNVLNVATPQAATTIAGFVTATYWFLMLIGRLIGAAIGGKVSPKAMLTFVSGLGLILVALAIFLPTSNMLDLPVLMRSPEGTLSFGLANVPINAAFLVLTGLCMSVMWGGIFNLAVEGLGKYTEIASGFFMVMVCGGGLLPLLQSFIIDVTDGGYMASYWVIFMGLAYLLYYALIGSKNVNKDIAVE
ncbi:MAG: MFS transporter [Bacteroidales bacterium]|nr:MFS transporter [Bacteroidales bacterium]